ncbi:MAG: DUF1573 domain-containing protein [Muribaculaceae bacterium]|nr:DUF1573 domain-containing protein [Muribaculaceae bacterium]
MKTYTLFLSLIAGCAMQAGAAVEWQQTTRDFGAFDEDMGPVSTDFSFVNTGSEPVSIIAARASCGCTSPQYPREAIAPGDTARITVTYDPAGRPGRFSKYVSVNLSDDTNTKLYVKGTVVGSAGSVARRFPVDCSPTMQLSKGVLMTGEVPKGRMRTVFMDAYNRSTDSIRPRVSDLPPYFEVAVTPEVVPPGEQMSFIFYFHSAKCPDYGIVNDSVYVWPDSNAPEPCLLPTVALVREDFSKLTPGEMAKAPHALISETSLDFGILTGPASREFTIKNTGKSPLKIRRVYTADRGITVRVDRDTLKPGKEAKVTVTADPSQVPGALLNARVAVITNDPDRPTASVRAVGELR